MSGSTAGGSGTETEIAIAQIRTIANSTMSDIESGATDTTSFRNTHLGEGAFGEVPMALDFAAQQRAAHHVFKETIAGVLADLQTFADNLRSSADAHEANDDAVQATLSQLNSTYADSHTYEADKRNLQARSDEDLIVPDSGDAGSDQPQEQPSEPAAETPPDPVAETGSDTSTDESESVEPDGSGSNGHGY